MTTIRIDCERGRVLEVELDKVALACIDFQVDFVAPEGLAASRGLPIAPLAEALAPAERMLQVARRAGMFVFHTRECYAPDLSDLNTFRRRHDKAIGSAGPLGRFLIRGERGTEILRTMQPLDGEPVIDKAGFNAFHQTTLDTVLRTRGIETLLLTGYTTQCCVSSTLRAAVDHGYGCVLLQDATAAFDRADHAASVRVIYSENNNFGWVSDTASVERALSAPIQK